MKHLCPYCESYQPHSDDQTSPGTALLLAEKKRLPARMAALENDSLKLLDTVWKNCVNSNLDVAAKRNLIRKLRKVLRHVETLTVTPLCPPDR